MLETITSHILDILQNDSRLYAGGTEYASGWDGVRRVETSSAQKNYVNLYDHPLDRSGARPAIFVGMEGFESKDELDYETHDGYLTQARIAYIPLVLVCRSEGQHGARKQKEQLKKNVMQILLAHAVETGYWYELSVETVQSKPFAVSDGNTVADSLAVMFLAVRYNFSPV